MEACAPVGQGGPQRDVQRPSHRVLAANAFLDVVAEPAFWDDMQAKEDFFYPALRNVFDDAGLTVWVQATGARFNLLFGLDREPTTYREAARCDRALETRFYGAALERGVYFHYSWHHGFSALHTRADLEQALDGIDGAARSIART